MAEMHVEKADGEADLLLPGSTGGGVDQLHGLSRWRATREKHSELSQLVTRHASRCACQFENGMTRFSISAVVSLTSSGRASATSNFPIRFAVGGKVRPQPIFWPRSCARLRIRLGAGDAKRPERFAVIDEPK